MDKIKIYDQYMYSYPHKTAYTKLDNVDLRTYLNRLGEEEDILYFHIPFCETKCGYCNLFSVVGKNASYYDKYIDALERQLIEYNLKDSISFKSVVMGGGTPLILTPEQIEKIFVFPGKYCNTDIKKAYTAIETSPRQTEDEKLGVLKQYEINRISIGVQSFKENALKFLCRNHKPSEARKSIEKIKDYNFETLNIDLIYGVPGQTIEDIKYSLESALYYEPEEIFIYPLYVQKHTILNRQGKNSSETTYREYMFMSEYLKEHGYTQKSMRCFVKNNLEQNNNEEKLKALKLSCGFERSLAIGCGGRTYIDELHMCTPYKRTMCECIEEIDRYIYSSSFMQIGSGYILNEDELKRRYIIKNLLYYTGIPVLEYENYYKADIIREFPIITDLIKGRYVEKIDNIIRLTPLGLGYSDGIGPLFISREVRDRMEHFD